MCRRACRRRSWGTIPSFAPLAEPPGLNDSPAAEADFGAQPPCADSNHEPGLVGIHGNHGTGWDLFGATLGWVPAVYSCAPVGSGSWRSGDPCHARTCHGYSLGSFIRKIDQPVVSLVAVGWRMHSIPSAAGRQMLRARAGESFAKNAVSRCRDMGLVGIPAGDAEGLSLEPDMPRTTDPFHDTK